MMTFGSCCCAVSIAAASSSGPCTFEMPIEEPARAGLTKTGKPSRATEAATPSGFRIHSPRRTATYGPIGSPAEASSRFMNSLSMLTAEESTPEPT